MNWQLTTIFLIGAGFSFLIAGVIYFELHRLRTKGSKPAAVWDLSIYMLFVVGIFFLSGVALEKFVPDYHRHLIDAKYLVTSPEPTAKLGDSKALETPIPQEKQVDGMGVGELMTLLGILTGIPVAFAGSVYAILLARRADHTATEQLEGDFESRLEEITGKITGNFSHFVDRLLEVNATAGGVFERAYILINPLMLGNVKALSLQECAEIIEKEELPRLKQAINQLRDCVTAIQSHAFSTEVLARSLDCIKPSLAASFFTSDKNYRQPKKPWAWLTYCERECASLVNPLEMLRVQVMRLNGLDVLAGVLEAVLINAAQIAVKHLDISDNRIDFDELFFNSWLQQGTRGKDEIYFLRSLGRILRTDTLKRNSRAEPLRTINIGAVILEDLYRMIPTRDHIKTVVMGKGVGLRLNKMNTKLVDDHFKSISYAGNELFPSYFSEGVRESLEQEPQAGGEPPLVLRLPAYIERIYSLMRNEMEQPGKLSDNFKVTLLEYMCDSLIDASAFSSENVDVAPLIVRVDPSQNAAVINRNPSLEKRIETLRALSLLNYHCDLWPGKSEQYNSLAKEATQGSPALLQQCNLDEGDFEFRSGALERALGAYSRAFEGGRPGNTAQFSSWLEGLLRKFPHTLYIQGELLTCNEVAAEDGMLPMLCSFFFRSADIDFRSDKKALLDFKVEFSDGFIFPDCVQLATMVQAFLANLPAHGNKGYELDRAYTDLCSRFVSGEFVLLSPASTT